MDLKEHLSILNHLLIIYVEKVKNGSFLKPTVLRFEPRLMNSVRKFSELRLSLVNLTFENEWGITHVWPTYRTFLVANFSLKI